MLGIILMRSRPADAPGEASSESTSLSSFLAGLSITRADQKAIPFYFGFFPAFIDLAALSAPGVLMILALMSSALGSAKLVYVYLAIRAGRILNSAGLTTTLNRLAGLIVMAVGLYVLSTAA